jgi:heme oxygenase
MKRKSKYTKELARRLYTYFVTYQDTKSSPSFIKFAISIGITLEELESYRKHKEFDRAYRECNEIRRDYLTDRALAKCFDASFVKFLLCEDGREEDTDDGRINMTLEVIR